MIPVTIRDRVEILDRMEPLVPEWQHLAQHCDVSPFLWPGWIGAWWRAFGEGRLQLFAAYQNGRLAGILPMRRYRGVLSSPTNTETPLFGFVAANESAVTQLVDALISQKARRAGRTRGQLRLPTRAPRTLCPGVLHDPSSRIVSLRFPDLMRAEEGRAAAVRPAWHRSGELLGGSPPAPTRGGLSASRGAEREHYRPARSPGAKRS
jgi:hypothetical protein